MKNVRLLRKISTTGDAVRDTVLSSRMFAQERMEVVRNMVLVRQARQMMYHARKALQFF